MLNSLLILFSSNVYENFIKFQSLNYEGNLEVHLEKDNSVPLLYRYPDP